MKTFNIGDKVLAPRTGTRGESCECVGTVTDKRAGGYVVKFVTDEYWYHTKSLKPYRCGAGERT